MSKGTGNAALAFIFVTILVDVIGLGIIIPVIPTLIMELTGKGLSEASLYGGWLIFAFAIMQFLFAPVLGGLSDQFGRRTVLLISLFGFGIDYIILGFAPTLAWLFAGRVVAGICGASFTTAGAYIADISAPEKRAQNFGMIGAAFGLGFIVGPVMGGLLGQFGSRVPFFVSAGLTLLNWLYGYFILPESLKPEHRRPFNWKRANPLGSLLQLRKYPVVLGLIGAMILLYLSGHSYQSTWAYYTMYKFNWSETAVGLSLGFVGLTVAIVQGGLTRILVPRLGPKRAIYIGLIINALGCVGFAFAFEGWMMYAIMVPFALGGLAGPTLQGLISNQVPANAQGELQGALSSLVSLTSVVGPPMMTGLFGYFTSAKAPVQFPGAPFIMGAFLVIVSLIGLIKPLRNLGSI